jgi:HlyD family secretion protein
MSPSPTSGGSSPACAYRLPVDAYPGEPFRGSIRDIRNAPQVVQNVVTYDAVIDVANDDLKLKPGMTATVSVVTDRRKDVMAVPNAALRFRPEGVGPGGQRTVAASRRTPGGARERGARRPWLARARRAVARPTGDDDAVAAPVKRTVYVLVDGQAGAA